jgi:hypothetical protein
MEFQNKIYNNEGEEKKIKIKKWIVILVNW